MKQTTPARELSSSRGVKWYRSMWKGTTWQLLFDPSNVVKTSHDITEAPKDHALYEIAVAHPERPSKRVKVYVGTVKDYARLGCERPWMFWALMKAVKEGNSVWFRVKEMSFKASYVVSMIRQAFDYAIDDASARTTRCVWVTPRAIGVRVHTQPLL